MLNLRQRKFQRKSQSTPQKQIWRLSIALTLVLLTVGCRPGGRGADRIAEDASAAQNLDTTLTFNNITLEQPDESGKTMWKVKAEQVIYTPDKVSAQVINPYGQLYQDGKPIYQIQGQRGEVKQDGKQKSGYRIFLRGEVVATDTKSGAVLRGDELEWRPEQDLLVVRRNLRGSHPQMKLSANEAKLSNRKRQIDLSGKVVAISSNPDLQLQGEHLVWQMDNQKIISDRPTQVERLRNKKVTDQASSNQAEVNLKTKIVDLKQNAKIIAIDPPLQVMGNSLSWNLNEETLVADQPVTVVHRQQQVTLNADRGRMNMQQKVAYLTGNVRAVGTANRSELTADSLTWTIPTQQLEAEGNVVYNQAANPPMTLKGPRAVGKMENQVIVVSGGRVVTEIIPDNLE